MPLFRKVFAGFLGFLQHPRESLCIEMSLIERDPAVCHHAGDDAGLSCARADGANAAFAAPGDSIDLGTHLCRSQKCVSTAVHGRAARMRRLSAKSDSVSLDPKSSQHCTEWKIEIEQNGTLLDMQFQICRRIFQFFARISDLFEIDSVLLQRVH